MNKNILKRFLILIISCMFIIGCNVNLSNDNNEVSQLSGLEIHYIDVGQGDATLIKTDGHAMLIDAGNNSKGTYIQSYLMKEGISSLDYVIGTHPDADHIGGMDVAIYNFDCDTIIMPDCEKDTRTYDDVIQTMKNKNYVLTYPKVGTTYKLGDAEFTIIAPNKNYSSANDNSVGIILKYGNNRFLFTGDAEEESEKDIINNGIDISADVYKAAHHGSRTASTERFMKKVNPRYVVISAGEGNSYGHPHSEILNYCRMNNIEVYRTDEIGTIIAKSDGNKITFNTSSSDSWTPGEESNNTTNADISNNEQEIQEGNYVINKNTKKFHKADCSSVKKMTDNNKEYTKLSREELIQEGYSPCSICEP